METRTKWGYLPLIPPRSSQLLKQFGAQKKPLSLTDDGEDETMVRTKRWVLVDVPSPRTPVTGHQTPPRRGRTGHQSKTQAGLGSNRAGSRGQVVK